MSKLVRLLPGKIRGSRPLITNGNLGFAKFTVGAVVEVPDQTFHVLMADYPGHFEEVTKETKQAQPLAESVPGKVK